MTKDCIIFSYPNNERLVKDIANKLGIEIGLCEIRNFPDGESYVRINSIVANKTVLLVAELDHPNSKMLPLMFMAATLRELGATKICLIAPYLPYMRQDKRFKSGEAVSAILFAKYVSSWIDYLITFDPHLHRIHHLSDIYTLESISVLHSANKIAEWIQSNVSAPFIIGPDEESQQWVAHVAAAVNAPFTIIKKIRYDDRKVTISIPEIIATDKTPVLVDDIISTGTSMMAAIQELITRGFKKPVCIGVHALFTEETYQQLLLAGAENIVTCNTISHFSNKIDITDMIIAELKRLQLV